MPPLAGARRKAPAVTNLVGGYASSRSAVRIGRVPLPAGGLASASPREVPRISYSPFTLLRVTSCERFDGRSTAPVSRPRCTATWRRDAAARRVRATHSRPRIRPLGSVPRHVAPPRPTATQLRTSIYFRPRAGETRSARHFALLIRPESRTWGRGSLPVYPIPRDDGEGGVALRRHRCDARGREVDDLRCEFRRSLPEG